MCIVHMNTRNIAEFTAGAVQTVCHLIDPCNLQAVIPTGARGANRTSQLSHYSPWLYIDDILQVWDCTSICAFSPPS